MTVRILSRMDVRRLLPMEECIETMREALTTLARGDALQPLRSVMRLPPPIRLLGMMPAYLSGPERFGIKVISVFPGNHGTELDAHQGAILLFEGERGRLVAIVDATEVTAVRTAAVSAVATDALARPTASEVAIIGSGVQALSHLRAIAHVRCITSIRFWSPDPERLKECTLRAYGEFAFKVDDVDSIREAVEGAHIVCTATSSSEPVLEGNWLEPGVHVNAIGACTPNARELDSEAVRMCTLFVDRRESVLAESGDFLIPKAEGVIDDDHIAAELGDVLLGRHPGRRDPEERTLFKSLGVGVEDVAAARAIYDAALEHDVGVDIDLGGVRDVGLQRER